MKNIAVAFLIAVIIFLAYQWHKAYSGWGDKDCKDFINQDQAQRALSRDKSDPNRLDGDKDGIACQTYPF